MKVNTKTLSNKRLKWLKLQGYTSSCTPNISESAFGIRFAYRVCVVLLLLAVPFANIALLKIMMVIAYLGVILPYHPFDYLYNSVLAPLMHKPRLAPRKPQLKFACAIATPWVGLIIYFFANQQITAGFITGGLLIGAALVPSTIDLCLPSLLYDLIYKKADC